jgi:hypothetical protein
MIPARGIVTVDGVVMDGDSSPVAIEFCCVGGDEAYGNPLIIKAPEGFEAWIEVGGTHLGSGMSRNVLMSASFQPAPTSETLRSR